MPAQNSSLRAQGLGIFSLFTTFTSLFNTTIPPQSQSPTESIIGQPLLGNSFGIPGRNSTYDFLIVGGGTAGLVLANRLSASGTHSVAVIEAGSFYELSNGNLSQIPRNVWDGNDNPLVDWGFMTEPEEALGGMRMPYTRGRTLGGCSARNNMVYQRGTKGSYGKWAEEVGDEDYEWGNFKAFFDRSTTFYEADMGRRDANSTPAFDPAGGRATGGPVSLSYVNYVLPFTSWMMKAVEAMGMKKIPGFIDGELLGSSWQMHTIDARTQLRDSSETAYLRPALKRENLVVYPWTMAMKVLFEGKVAKGVVCNTMGKDFVLTAKKEVILSAGALQSPQLLMVSGIGQRETLEKFKIPVLMDAPGVGQGLEDHPALLVTHKMGLPSSTVLDSPAKNAAAVKDFLADGTGPLTSWGGEVVSWEKVPRRLVSNDTATALDTVPTDWPDLEYLSHAQYPGLPPDADDYGGVIVVLANTFSRGTVNISSASMLDPPVTHVAFLSDVRDQELAVAGIRRAREILTHPSLSSVVVGPEVLPGNATTDAQILQFIQASGRTISHASCTCKMGKRGDELAVVDSQGRVFGTERLRVVDASAMPFLPPGHPMSTVYALAEKISEDVLSQY
ncbi:putative glucose-methanol-choline oxidoreductase [Massarina eburnea CBS 473.64]|uniref:Putative glucose-methanol-choline oxidoreductase n=1 Tax=Massarina eburnea CBS 473.64 TaxID=1395130 RepID=A0A6A6RVS6_9PLEO|nr:putative glucose-methanol-choline oxidoreductase [Massarina eburnea CBS 473.64]